jgi:methyl-accepting chemotaxis protein
VWLEPSYNPILDSDGKPLRVVKIASDITRQVQASDAGEAISRIRQGAAEVVRAVSSLSVEQAGGAR